jgi:hypothetical protein
VGHNDLARFFVAENGGSNAVSESSFRARVERRHFQDEPSEKREEARKLGIIGTHREALCQRADTLSSCANFLSRDPVSLRTRHCGTLR